jgi:solute carrier family 25 (mitochondrial S-adenosylmethionine transporter), member 26
VRVPTDVIKTRMQASSYEKQAKSSLSAARIVWANEGLHGFYRGYSITVMREVGVPCYALSYVLAQLLSDPLHVHTVSHV